MADESSLGKRFRESLDEVFKNNDEAYSVLAEVYNRSLSVSDQEQINDAVNTLIGGLEKVFWVRLGAADRLLRRAYHEAILEDETEEDVEEYMSLFGEEEGGNDDR